MYREGTKVAMVYADVRTHTEVGDTGKVVASGHEASHIHITSGFQAGQIVLVRNEDFVPTNAREASLLDDSISEAGFVHTAVRAVFDRYGSVGLINDLSAEGSLSTFDAIAEQTLAFMASKVRQDPGVIQVMAELDADEQDEFVQTAVATILRDAFEVA
jgi:hypothetical protein